VIEAGIKTDASGNSKGDLNTVHMGLPWILIFVFLD